MEQKINYSSKQGETKWTKNKLRKKKVTKKKLTSEPRMVSQWWESK